MVADVRCVDSTTHDGGENLTKYYNQTELYSRDWEGVLGYSYEEEVTLQLLSRDLLTLS